MDTANLSAFLAVAEHASFSRAAEQLHLTQPAISKRIATLEQQLDARLFDRIGRHISMTEAGRALKPRAEQIITALKDTRRALGNLSSQVQGRLSMATSHHIGLHRLPPVLRTYTAAYPDVALDIDFLDSEVAYDKVLHGEIELAVITLAPILEPPIMAKAVWDDPLDFVVAPEHPLANLPQVDLAQLAAYPAVFPGVNTFTHKVVSQLFQQRGVSPQIRMSTNYLETIKMMVSIGLAWSVLPRTMLDTQVKALQVPDVTLQRQLGVIWHSGRTLSNAGQALVRQLDCKQM
ncbi:LysR family transcriptional regulator [Halopseudomonas pelagia]|uniref:LysR family transcriptional regulator n=1 Tax=Halopseudomonas pelagia TaxID=553151 RepID=A0AA91U4J9_9GAMM|nr:LysR family transcriptional regulator [Halopseudomonas pelagia]PCD00274.1 LysR family transcriptional regulator [Halopseudomonas pelagia]QFY56934.1 LysR family transcriptional regulator [Halopseudomonas pelagia]